MNFIIKMFGPYACFSRPENSVEKYTYDIITPINAQNILRCVYGKPGMTWVIDKIHVYNDIKKMTYKYNGVELKGKIAKSINDLDKVKMNPSDIRAQLNNTVLKDVCYVVEAHIELTAEETENNNLNKHNSIAKRRLEKGQCNRQPFFGCKEYMANLELLDKVPENKIQDIELGVMPISRDYINDKTFFSRLEMKNGTTIIPKDIKNHTINDNVNWMSELIKAYDSLVAKGELSIGLSKQNVEYVIEIDEEGNLNTCDKLEIRKDATDKNGNIKIDKKGNVKQIIEKISMTLPSGFRRSSGIVSDFLYGTGKYILGCEFEKMPKNEKEKEQQDRKNNKEIIMYNENEDKIIKYDKSKEAMESFINNIKLHNENLKHPFMSAIIKFYENFEENFNKINKQDLFNMCTQGIIVFRVNSDYVLENNDIKNYWTDSFEKNENKMYNGDCICCGKTNVPIPSTHRAIKSVNGAQSSGASIVSYNATAFNKYGYKGMENSPVCKICSDKYVDALNYFLTKKEHVLKAGNLTFVFWSENNKISREISGYLSDGKISLLQDAPELNDKFNVLVLSGNSGRIAIVDFFSNTLDKLHENIQDHQRCMKFTIKDENEFMPTLYKLTNIFFDSMESANEKYLSNVTKKLIMSILWGQQYPKFLYLEAMSKIKTEKENIDFLTHNVRLSMIKAYYARKHKIKEDILMLSEETLQTPMYKLGRILALMVKIQKANGNVGNSLKDRFFASLMRRPINTIPIIQNLHNAHMSQLMRKRTGTAIFYNKQITEIFASIGEIPKNPNSDHQAEFIMGYYAQEKENYKKHEKETEDDE